jgi:hypothetical protein
LRLVPATRVSNCKALFRGLRPAAGGGGRRFTFQAALLAFHLAFRDKAVSEM